MHLPHIHILICKELVNQIMHKLLNMKIKLNNGIILHSNTIEKQEKHMVKYSSQMVKLKLNSQIPIII